MAHLGARLVDRDSWLELSDCGNGMPAVVLAILGGEGHRRPKIKLIVTASEVKRRRHHANHGVALAVECDCLIQDFGIAAKTPLPQPVTQDHYVVVSRLIFFGQKVATQLRLSAEHRKKAFGDIQSTQPLRIACADQVKR